MRNSDVLETSCNPNEARWWELEPGGRVRCDLCPRRCRMGDGQHGYCLIRANHGGRLFSLAYASPAAVQVDPIEKKPLHHFLPGTPILSLGTAGCSLGCCFCQNWDLVHAAEARGRTPMLAPEDVVRMAGQHHCPAIAFTYNEPTVWGEYAVDISRIARRHGLRTVMVTNGYVTREAFHDIFDHMDAANVDLKAFTEEFYRRRTLAHLQPVLDTLRWIWTETPVWLEITNLMIPGLNDDPMETRRLVDWILEHLGPDVPLHFTAFHPDHKLRDLPPTRPETLHGARAIARHAGLRFVYEGNVPGDGLHTYCPGCDALLIRRGWHETIGNRLRDGACPDCGQEIPGRWTVAQVAPAARGPLAAGAGDAGPQTPHRPAGGGAGDADPATRHRSGAGGAGDAGPHGAPRKPRRKPCG